MFGSVTVPVKVGELRFAFKSRAVCVAVETGLFASLVTYGIPFVAIGWGIYFGEQVTPLHICSLIVILLGVFFANRNGKNK